MPKKSPTKSRARSRKLPPPARIKPRLVKGLRVTAASNGYIIYDTARERVHYLNHTAGLVMDLCTGKNSWPDIVTLVATAYGLKRKPGKEVGALLRQLASEGLVSLES